MNLDFGILWIEDTYNPEEKANLERRVEAAGFIPRIEVVPNGETIEDLGRRQSLYHCFDIILLDYKLKNEDGDDLAPRVRRLFPSTTILFYSGNDDEDGLRSKIATRKVEGVYCSHRNRFIERTGLLIDQTARALDRLSGMRGLAMRVVAECDELMKDAVRKMAASSSLCEAKLRDLDEDVNSHLDILKARYEEASQQDLEARLNTFAVDSTKLFKHFSRLTRLATANKSAFGLNDEQVDRLRELRNASANYPTDVLKKRNILGHANENQGENGWVLQGTTEITIADFPYIRQAFAAHINAFREIGVLVSPREQ